MANYDLTHTIGSYLDRHLVFPLLEFLQSKELYSEPDILLSKIHLLSKTNMVDFEIDIYKVLQNSGAAPPEMDSRLGELETKRKEVIGQIKQLNEQLEKGKLFALINDRNLVAQLRQDKLFSAEYLKENYGVSDEDIDILYKFAKFQYDCGNYSGAAEYLYHYIPLSVGPNNEKGPYYFSALWGRFSADILVGQWNEALEDMTRLKDAIDSKNFGTPLEQLQQRTWLIHWSLFVFFNHPNGRNGIIDLFFQEKYLNAIQTTCPHILRYLTTAVITNKRRRNVVKDLVRILQQEHYTYKDPITEFLECLFVHFDFDEAQKKLSECEQVLNNDYFLVACSDEFKENARLFIFETYCRIHNTIDIGMLAERLGLDQESAERWIVDLIRNARLDAKIDSAKGHVIMGTQYPSIYQQIIDKTKGLSFRSNVLASQLKQSV